MDMDQQNHTVPNVPPPFPPGQVPSGGPPAAQQVAPDQPKRSGMAIASLVLGILSPISCGVTGIVGLILGIVSLVSIKKSLGRLTGQGLAIGGIVVSAVVMLLIPVIAAIVAALVPAVSAARDHARQRVATSNLRQLSTALHMYATDYDDLFPDPDDWQEQLTPYVSDIDQVVISPFDQNTGRMFAMNAAFLDISGPELVPMSLDDVKAPALTVLFFEAAPGSPLAGGPELFPGSPRGPTGYIIGFVDGHVEAVVPEDIEALIWQPQHE